jgi:hypothetical protein
MAGTLITSTLQGTTLTDGTNSTSTTNCIQGSAKAWVNFNGVSGTINGSYNVTSVTKNATGDFTANFTTAMPNANYAWAIGYHVNPGSGQRNLGFFEAETLATTSIRIFSSDNSGTAWDVTAIAVSILSS